MDTNYFAFIPVEVIQDKRLTFEQTRVLIALFSFRGKNTNTVWPSRDAISQRCCMHISNISQATKALEALGWLTKDGSGGFSKASRYTITVPDLETVAEQATVAESARGGVAESAMPTVAESARGKELTKELTKELKKTRAAKPRSSSGPVTLNSYLADCEEQGKKPIPDDHYIRTYAADTGITNDMLGLCWLRFKEEHTEGARKTKRQKDWGQTFGNCVKDNWYGFWYVKDGVVTMSSKCEIFRASVDAQRERAK